MHFKERAHEKLGDERLQRNLQKIKGKFVGKRRSAITELDDFEGTRDAAYRIIEGKGATNHAIGLSAADIVQAVIRDENRILPVSSHLDDWLGIKNVTMSVPTLVGRHGAAQPFELKITGSELVALRRSGETISNELRGLGF